jgi:hypothetical protein
MNSDEFVHMAMAFADDMARQAANLALDKQGANGSFIQSRSDLLEMLRDSVKSMLFDAYADGRKDERQEREKPL